MKQNKKLLIGRWLKPLGFLSQGNGFKSVAVEHFDFAAADFDDLVLGEFFERATQGRRYRAKLAGEFGFADGKFYFLQMAAAAVLAEVFGEPGGNILEREVVDQFDKMAQAQ